jgi:hypothetical protein
VDNNHYNKLLQWVETYFKSYYGLDEEVDANIKLKEKHTFLVVEYGKAIAEKHLKDQELSLMAMTSCLLHDIGRFSQFKQYRTFRDQDSFDHSLLGLDIIFKNNLLKDFTNREQVVIQKAVYCHNKVEIGEGLTNEEKTICNLVRDADKLDIFRVITECYEEPYKHKNVFIGKGLSEKPGYTQEILEQFLNRKIIGYSQVVTKDDLKLLQLAWIFDLNFSTSYEIVREKGYGRRIINYLPQNTAKHEIEKLVFEYIGKQR